MVRTPLTPLERERGRLLGTLLRAARGERSMTEVAAEAGVSAETLRKIETGRAPTPAFFTVAALTSVLGLTLDDVAARCAAVTLEDGLDGRQDGQDGQDGDSAPVGAAGVRAGGRAGAAPAAVPAGRGAGEAAA